MFQPIIDIIKKYDSIVIFGHINPDGDCYGSALGLKKVIQINFPEKKVYITGSGLPNFFKFLEPMDEVSDEVISKSLGIIVDGNDLDRMEDSRVHNCIAWAKIDHHVDTGSFTEGPAAVDEEANSTCDIIVKMILDYDLQIDEVAANALYLGILTDSARFQFVHNYARTFQRVSFLCAKGASPAKLNSILTHTTEKELMAKGYVLNHYKKSKEGVLSIFFDKETLAKLNLGANDASNMINLLANVDDCPVWVSFAEYTDGAGRIEFRSNGPAVQPFAHSIGGGGHLMAAGAPFEPFSEERANKIIEGLDELVRNWRKENA